MTVAFLGFCFAQAQDKNVDSAGGQTSERKWLIEANTANAMIGLGIGAGYAIFLGENVSVEPGLRYNLSLNQDYTDKEVFQFNVGFALHF